MSYRYDGLISSTVYDKNLEHMLQTMVDNTLNGEFSKVEQVRKFRMRIIDISKTPSPSIIHDYLHNHVIRLFGFELIKKFDNFYLCKTGSLYWNFIWQIVNDSFEFTVNCGFHYKIDADEKSASVHLYDESKDYQNTIIDSDDSDNDSDDEFMD